MKEEVILTKKEENKKDIIELAKNTNVGEELTNLVLEETEKIFLLRERTKKSLGEIFSNIREKLGGENQYNGFFGKWYQALGFKKDFVYNCINYFKLLVDNSEDQKIQELSFSKVCEIAKLKEIPEIQKQVIEKAPLNQMKFKQVTKLVREVKERKEVTEELINEICNNADEVETNFGKYIKTTTSFIKELEESSKTTSKEELEKILKLVDEVKNLCEKAKLEVQNDRTN